MTALEFRTSLKAIGLSQYKLSDRIGVNISTINRWATGKLPVPKYASAYLDLLALCRAAAV